ncbi:DUF5814 domain-containing protein [Methanococcus voltae]|uniref:DEAD/DEAH box helicase domain protein n=1 Tax=Methanococcus voltae (strain ATCC BAA-1334 / A3) TaxID=456320 RepID=D7DRP3_METV3|nr:DUF5814 domain-containing protein [Methanococcus voltae]MCS3901120.1 helicase [Methanococcus voltae]
MLIIRKPKKKKDEIQITDLKTKTIYYATLRPTKTKITLYKCKEQVESNITPLQPSKLMTVLREKKIYISNDPESLKFGQFLEENNLNYGIVVLCPFCLLNGKYNIIDVIKELKPSKKAIKLEETKNKENKESTGKTEKTKKEKKNTYKIYKTNEVCLECAINEIKHEININEEFIEKLLRRFKDADKVISLFTTSNPVKNPDLTRYDILTGNEEDKIDNFKIKDLEIPELMKKELKNRNIYELLPVQTLAVKAGLISKTITSSKGHNNDLLITSATSSGKTLIGELAGIKNLENGKNETPPQQKKFLFLVPLVALANQKYVEFEEKYSKLGYKVALRVGTGRLAENKNFKINSDPNSDIIVGTYEGIDYLIRSGKLKDVGTVIIDEVHTLNMEERGARLDGLISRLRTLFDAQIIYLSATIGNPEELSKQFNSNLVIYSGRPVPLERHLIFARNDYAKLNNIVDIVNIEFNSKSKYGYRGQSLIFTFSRKRAEYIANYLNTRGIKADYYHGGMEYGKRRAVENRFMTQKTKCIVTTAALAAGVDFPASAVVLESLAMGGDWLNASEFQQMCGRAGRKGMHDLGKVYTLVEVGKKYHAKMELSEDEIAFRLLGSEPQDVDVVYEEEQEFEQILATISSFEKYGKNISNEFDERKINLDDPKLKLKDKINPKYEIDKVPMLGRNLNANYVLEQLEKFEMISLSDKKALKTTRYGNAVSLSFLYPQQAEEIKKLLKKCHNKNKNRIMEDKDISDAERIEDLENKRITRMEIYEEILDISVKANPFESIYIPGNLKNRISKITNVNVPSKFTDAFEIVKENINKLKDSTKDDVINWLVEFDGCIEEDIAYEVSKRVIRYRMMGEVPSKITNTLYEVLKLQTYGGDVYSYLESTVNTLDAIERISKLHYPALSKYAVELKLKIENPFNKKIKDNTKYKSKIKIKIDPKSKNTKNNKNNKTKKIYKKEDEDSKFKNDGDIKTPEKVNNPHIKVKIKNRGGKNKNNNNNNNKTNNNPNNNPNNKTNNNPNNNGKNNNKRE